MRHSSWKGYLRLSLVSVPVRAYSVNNPAEQIALHQLHRDCHNRIRYTKTCPVHGEVSREEIVSGYENEPGQYVIFEKDELTRLRGERERSITIEAVVEPGTIDLLYGTEKSYYLYPDEKVAEQPFALLRQALADEELEAVGRGVLFGRPELLLIRPQDDVLAVTAVKYAARVAAPADFGEVAKQPVKKEELELTKTLLETFTRKNFSLAAFTDDYMGELKATIKERIEGKEVVAGEEKKPERAPTINLMDALKKSLAGKEKPERARRPAPRQRRKSG
jgi:DNA end-binding protein Ku